MDRRRGSDGNYGILKQFTLVLVYDTGKKYHIKRGCNRSKGCRFMTLAAAEMRGYGKCKNCFK